MDFKNKYLKYKNKYLALKQLQNGGSYGYVMGPENKDILDFKNIDLRDTLNQSAIAAILNRSMPQSDVNKHLLTATVTVFNRINEVKTLEKKLKGSMRKGKNFEAQINKLKSETSKMKSEISKMKKEDEVEDKKYKEQIKEQIKEEMIEYLAKEFERRTESQQTGGNYGFVMDPEIKDITEFKNMDLRDTLNEPALASILDESMNQLDVNKHLLTAIVTVHNLVKYAKSQSGGGFVMGSELKDITEFKNIDVRDTLNQSALAAMLNGTMPQSDVNTHLLTAIVTVNNNINLQ